MHDIALPDWAVERGKWLNSFDAIDPARSALVVIDMQRAFAEEGEVFANPHAMDIVPAVNLLAQAMRRAGGAVVWTRQTAADLPPLSMAPWQYDPADPEVRRALDALTPGTASHGLLPDMNCDATDVILDKYRYSAFACPAGALERWLGERDIDTLVIAGTLTNVCCESTARDAYMRGYKVICVSDAMATVTDEEHNAALLSLRIHFADVQDTQTLVSMLAQPALEGPR